MPDTASTELDQPDPDTPGVMRMLGLSKKSVYRLGVAGEIDGYLLGGSRRWRLPSVRAYKARQIAKGPQLGPPATGPRPRGRPRKHPRPEQPASPAE
jgi:predicted DNA-binding transcriptional regulator AlpA